MNEEAIYQTGCGHCVGRREQMKGIPRLYILILLLMYNGGCWVQAIMHDKVPCEQIWASQDGHCTPNMYKDF